MKFLLTEHKDIAKILSTHGFDNAEYSFRKKSGNIYLEIQGTTGEFCFYRKKETSLIDGKFQDKTIYFIGKDKKIQFYKWSDVFKCSRGLVKES